MAQGSLFLHATDPQGVIATDHLITQLQSIGLLGESLTAPQTGWQVGEAFLQLLTFMGCSPHIRLAPASPTDQDFCHLTLHHYAQPQLLTNPLARVCRCANCGKPMATNWQALDLQASLWECPFCAHRHNDLHSLRWRNDAGYARQFVEIHNIYPGEAQPVDALLERLASLGDVPWRYFYAFASGLASSG